MELYESAEDYLETVLILSKTLEKVRAIDVAHYLNFSKPSVSIAIHKLEANNYLKILPDGELKLTSKGQEIATNVYERHTIISKALMDLGVPEEIALKDACKIEHDISEEAFNALKKRVK